MKRSARFLVLDQQAPENAEADFIVLDIPLAQLRPLIRKLEESAALADKMRGQRTEVWRVSLFVEASHPRSIKQGDTVTHPPSLLKDSIPRAGRS